jgi:protein involved in polysaccharide export with SLBB domain
MKLFANGLFMSGLLLIAAVLAGCDSLPPQSPFVSTPPKPRTFDGQPNGQASAEVARFRVGETVVVTLTTGSTTDSGSDIAPHEEPIKEDGTITMPYIGKITAVGKTTGELQNEILTNYVPKYYVRLTVTVKSPADRVYYIGGQVNHAGVQAYLGETTVSKAIQAAGDFNDFASHTVSLTRVTGERIKVNVDRVLAGREVDPPVYPGDQIDVPRSLF